MNPEYATWQDAQDLKSKIDKHNANVKQLAQLYQKLHPKDKPPSFNYDLARLQSDNLKLNDVRNMVCQKYCSQQEQQRANEQLCQMYNRKYDNNWDFLQQLDEKITDRNQIININNTAFLKKSFWANLLTSFLVLMLLLLAITYVQRFGLMSRNTYVSTLTLIILAYLFYVLYRLYIAQYFQDPYYRKYKHLIDPNVLTLLNATLNAPMTFICLKNLFDKHVLVHSLCQDYQKA